MQNIKGYVCLVKLHSTDKTVEIMFGHQQGTVYPLEMKDAKLFESFRLAGKGRKILLSRSDVKSVIIAKLWMRIIESHDEIKMLEKSKNLVVIMDGEEGYQRWFGKHVEGRGCYPLPGSELKETGMKTIPTMDRAIHIAMEIRRQAQSQARIATFCLRRIKNSPY